MLYIIIYIFINTMIYIYIYIYIIYIHIYIYIICNHTHVIQYIHILYIYTYICWIWLNHIFSSGPCCNDSTSFPPPGLHIQPSKCSTLPEAMQRRLGGALLPASPRVPQKTSKTSWPNEIDVLWFIDYLCFIEFIDDIKWIII